MRDGTSAMKDLKSILDNLDTANNNNRKRVGVKLFTSLNELLEINSKSLRDVS